MPPDLYITWILCNCLPKKTKLCTNESQLGIKIGGSTWYKNNLLKNNTKYHGWGQYTTHLGQSCHKLDGSKVLENIYHFINLDYEDEACQHGGEVHEELVNICQHSLVLIRWGVVLKRDFSGWDYYVSKYDKRSAFLEQDWNNKGDELHDNYHPLM